MSATVREGGEGGTSVTDDDDGVRGWSDGIGVEWVGGLNRDADELDLVRGAANRLRGGGVRREALDWDVGDDGSASDPFDEADDRCEDDEDVERKSSW